MRWVAPDARMGIRVRLCVFWMAAVVLVQSATADSKKIEIGGPRKAVVVVSRNGASYEIESSLISVKCFDQGLNRRLSQEKARLNAINALARVLGHKSSGAVVLRGAEVVEARDRDSRFLLRMRVPVDGIEVKDAEKVTAETKPTEPPSIVWEFKAKEDYDETLRMIAEALQEEMPEPKGAVEGFVLSIDSLEQQAERRFEVLAEEVAGDRWLLSSERDELYNAITQQHVRCTKALSKRLERFEKQLEAGE